jgi:hypothetical protein
MIEVDEVVGCVGNARPPFAAVHRAAGSTGAKYFGVTGVAAPKAASSNAPRYSRTARRDRTGSSASTPCTPLWRFASALIRLASTAKPSPPTNPSAMQRRTTVSNTCRSTLLSRKPTIRFGSAVPDRSRDGLSNCRTSPDASARLRDQRTGRSPEACGRPARAAPAITRGKEPLDRFAVRPSWLHPRLRCLSESALPTVHKPEFFNTIRQEQSFRESVFGPRPAIR